MKKIYLFLVLLTPLISFGQYTVTDAATVSSCNCFEISNDATPSTVGSFYNTTSIDLSNDFNLKFVVNFGCDDFGGEGMAFLMQSGPWTVGSTGYGLGYQGIPNSLAVEFDTRDNNLSGEYINGADVIPDHISIQSNGFIEHDDILNNLGPVSPVNLISSGTNNAEDCEDHTIEIIWNSTAQTIDIIVDGNSVYTAPEPVGDIITNSFGGNPNVLWGWTGTTGVIANTQTVCIALEPEFTFTPTNCPGEQIDFTGSYWSNNNIVNYTWDFDGVPSNLQNPSHTFNTVGEHPITLTITDDTGCSNTETFDIGVGFNVTVIADNLSVCPDGTSQLNVIAQPYVGNECCFQLILTDTWDSWNNEIEIFVDGTTIGTFDITGAATGGPVTQTQELCFSQGSVISVVINGQQNQFESGYSIVQNGITMIEVLPGLAWVDGDTQVFTVDCGLTTAVYTYQWDNDPTLDNYVISTPIATVPETTYYVVNVTDPNTTCTITDSIQIITTDSVKAQLSGSEVVCEGGSGNLTVTFEGDGPFDFDYTSIGTGTVSETNITTNPYTLPVTIAGTYTLTSIIGNGCTGTIDTSGPDGGIGTLQIIIPPTVTIGTSASYCLGDTPISDLTVNSTNGGSVNWYSNPALTGTPLGNGNTFTPPISIVSATTYYAQETETVSGLNCAGPSDNVTITINAIPNAPLVSGITTYCEGDTPTPLTVEMTLGGIPNWFDNSNLTPPTVSMLLQYNPTLNVGIFCYYVNETAAGCTGDSTEICVETKPTPLTPTLTGNTIYCEGDTPSPIVATPTVGGDITWFNSIPTPIGSGLTYTPDLTLGNQTFTASESLNGCTGPTQSLSITVNVLPVVSLPETTYICFGDSVKITATHNNFDLEWSNGNLTESSWLGPDESSTYYITSTNPLCGSVVDSIEVIIYDLPDVVAGNDTVIGIGGEATLWATGAPIFTWTPSANECITTNCSEIYVIPNQATVYIVDGVDGNTCHNYDTVLVDISGFMEIFIPNIFSPNGDGFNDYLVIDGPRLFNFNIEIFDRWGKLIYTAENQKDYWDGKFKGTELASQTFVYKVTGETVLGEILTRSGNVTIIK